MRQSDKRRRRYLRKRQAAELAARAGRLEEYHSSSDPTAAYLDPKASNTAVPFEIAEEPAQETPGPVAGPEIAFPMDSAVSSESDLESSSAVTDEPLLDLDDGIGPANRPQEPAAEELLERAAREAVEQGDTGRASSIYSELLKLNPHNVKARNNLALLLDQAGDHEGALEALDRCLEQEPENVQVLVNRGAILGTQMRYRDAERDLREAVRIDPANAEGHFNLGVVAVRRALWAEAVPYLRRAVELDSSRAAAYFYLGEALNHVDDLQGALQSYQRATELQPVRAEYFYGLGIILDRLNRPDEAAQMYRRSREIAGR
ncbi:MAG: tetratricopeptide repeat protein [Gemmatimonadota bacterium]|nr:MAG: tetratricopeptide repeat protein [Gemmatimonadota bacterium]